MLIEVRKGAQPSAEEEQRRCGPKDRTPSPISPLSIVEKIQGFTAAGELAEIESKIA